MSERLYLTIFGDGQEVKPGYYWADPVDINMNTLAANITTDLTTGTVADSRFQRLFNSGSVGAQQAVNGMVTLATAGLAAMPASQQRIPTAGGTSQTQTGTTRAINSSDIIYHLNKYYGNFWAARFASDAVGATGVSPFVIRRTPIVQAEFVLHGCTITALAIVSGVARVTASANHGLYNKMRVTITGTGDVDYDNQSFYIKKLTATTFELYTDSALTTAATAAVTATAGTVVVHANETHRYKVSTIRVSSWGEGQFSYMSGTSTVSSNAARFDGNLYTPQNLGTALVDSFEDPDSGYYSRWAGITCTTNSSGYLTSVVLNTESPGQYADPGWTGGQGLHALMGFANQEVTNRRVAGPYTKYEWEDPGYVAGSPKNWPTSVKAASVSWIIDNPTAVVASQSGRKFTRSSGMPNYTITIKYPPMTRAQFRPVLAAIHQARGQHIGFHLILSEIAPGMFEMAGNAAIRVMSPIGVLPAGAVAFTAAGGDVLKYQALITGDNVQLPEIGNGELAIVTHDAHTSAWGTVDLRTTTPLYRPVTVATFLKLGTSFMSATLNTDKAEINIDTIERYGVELEFSSRIWA